MTLHLTSTAVSTVTHGIRHRTTQSVGCLVTTNPLCCCILMNDAQCVDTTCIDQDEAEERNVVHQLVVPVSLPGCHDVRPLQCLCVSRDTGLVPASALLFSVRTLTAVTTPCLDNDCNQYGACPAISKDMLENALIDAVTLANKKVEQFFKVSSLCLDDHQFKQEELESVGELSHACSQIVLKCLYLARIGRPDILVVCQQMCKSSHKMDSGMWQTIGNFGFVHSQHKWLPTILSCG